MITKNSCRRILKSTGMKVERIVVMRLQIHLEEIANKIANELKELAKHNGRRTIQNADFLFVMNKENKNGESNNISKD